MKALPKRLAPKKPVEIKTVDFNLVVYKDKETGIYKSELIRRDQSPLEVANMSDILTTLPIEMHEISSAKSSRYRAIKCRDELGVVFDSKLELVTIKEMLVYEKAGMITNVSKQVPFSFKKAKLNRVYKPDITFDCLKTFTIDSVKGPITFEKGKSYVCDVKSPVTKRDGTYSLKKALMRAVWEIEIIEIVRSYKGTKKTMRASSKSTSKTKKVLLKKKPTR
jgi:hypothetical protein